MPANLALVLIALSFVTSTNGDEAPFEPALDRKDRDAGHHYGPRCCAAGHEAPSPRWVDYHVGDLDARRLTWTLGRDLTREPVPPSGPVNAVAKGHLEVDGRECTAWKRNMTLHELRPAAPR